jgi:hypothetical protein
MELYLVLIVYIHESGLLVSVEVSYEVFYKAEVGEVAMMLPRSTTLLRVVKARSLQILNHSGSFKA